MSTATAVTQQRQYGSPADIAGLTGLSVKTLRRLMRNGSIEGVKLGRRVLIPMDAFERRRARTREAPAVAIAPSTASPHRSVDARGRALPMTEAEVRARAGDVARGLDSLDAIGDEAEHRQTLEALMTAVDDEPLSDRKRFR